jgi:FkbH-like protein
MLATNPLTPATTQNYVTIGVTATFTIEPIQESLNFWLKRLGLTARVSFAPYNQVFQQLLNPNSLLASNTDGINIVLIRFEDWCRFSAADEADSIAEKLAMVNRNAEELLQALMARLGQTSTPYILGFCPASPALQAEAQWSEVFQRWEARFQTELQGFANLHILQPQDLARYGEVPVYDAERDRLGHIPYTPEFFTVLGTAIARRLYTIKSAPHKVIVLDCDNTLWRGVVGEDGLEGIQFSEAYQALHSFMIKQQEAGMLLCLCSKNNEADVLEVFDRRPDMPLRREHLVTWRINWQPKSASLRSLAEELNLGLDSFIFLDDSAMECAEVRSACPEVLTLQLPSEADIPTFLDHVWAFDRLNVTEEDRQRTALYQQNVERSRLEQSAPTMEAFLASLNLEVQISTPSAEQLPRVAQLTQRTNQFNCTTRRRSAAEIQQLMAQGTHCWAVEVSDRFGDYGLVGVVIFDHTANALEVDTFLLSCRVLGRGVEYQVLRDLGQFAQQQGLAQVNLPFIPSAKNQPALRFLESCRLGDKQTTDSGFCFSFPAEPLTELVYTPKSTPQSSAKPVVPSATPAPGSLSHQKSDQLQAIATRLRSPQQILEQLRRTKAPRPRLDHPVVAPRTPLETTLAGFWAELLNLEAVGVTDNYFDLGGTSLMAVELFARIEQELGQQLPLTTLVECPTIEALAPRLDPATATTEQNSLVLLQAGEAEPPLFLIHDGEGETLLYRNLAQRLAPQRAVYGIQPLTQPGLPLAHTRITDMAQYYIEQIQQRQPAGPYLLGGMCAGGLIAFEVARQLEAQGQSVAMVALLDAADVAAPLRAGLIANERAGRFSSMLKQAKTLPWSQRLTYVAGQTLSKVTNVIRYEVTSRFERWQRQLTFKGLRFYLDRQRPLPSLLKGMSFRPLYLMAEADYSPQTQYAGELLLLRATQGEGDDLPHCQRYADPLLGWQKRTSLPVKVCDVIGGHASMLQEPYVEDLADKVNDYIQNSLGKFSGG